MDNASDGQTEEAQNLAHFIRLSLCEVIVDRNDMNAVAAQTVHIRSNACDKCLTFTGSHFSDSALMQNDRTDDLNGERLFAEHAVCCLTDSCQCFDHNIIEGFAVGETLAEFLCLCLQSSIGETLILLIQIQNLLFDRFNFSKLFFTVRAEDFVK